jgi:hypothetical protein
MVEQADVDAACRRFITTAFHQLAIDHVIPPPRSRRFLTLGEDYFGDQIIPLSEYRTLIDQIEEAYPSRFIGSAKLDQEHASSYVFSLLEACIARCAVDNDFDAACPAVTQSIRDLLGALEREESDVVAVRYVSHLTTVTGNEAQIGDIRVIPDPDQAGSGRRFMISRICDEIPGWPRLLRDIESWDPPYALLVTREKSVAREAYAIADRLTVKLDRFLLLARLLTGGSVRSDFQVSGPSTLVAGISPYSRTHSYSAHKRWVSRSVDLNGNEEEAFAALGALIDAAEIKREGMFATSFDVALSRFDSSHSGIWSSQLVDLATALEAALIGADQATEAVTFKLQTRVAALLVTEDDPADVLYRDVARLYDLRSKLVHGGQIRLDKHQGRDGLRQIVKKISTVPEDMAEKRFGIAVEVAVDRLRDIVRRAILARLCLGETPESLWPFNGSTAVDALLTVDANRVVWRNRWRDRLKSLGVGSAAEKARPVTDSYL